MRSKDNIFVGERCSMKCHFQNTCFLCKTNFTSKIEIRNPPLCKKCRNRTLQESYKKNENTKTKA